MYYRNKVGKNASLVDTKNFSQRKIQGWVTKSECEYVLNQIYEDRELKKIKREFKVYFDKMAKDRDEEVNIEFYEFQEFVFKQELKKHERYLKSISEFFNNLDTNNTGIITRKQFLSLLDVFVQRNITCDLHNVLKDLDPNNYNAITFSKTIEIMSQTYADEEKKMNMIECLNNV